MIAAPALSLGSSQLLGARIAARPSRPLSPRSPSLRIPRFAAARYSAPAAERPPAAFTSAAPSLYDVLGVPAGATCREIKAAYRRLARACHPDVAAGGRDGASAAEFMRVHAAYATLSDPEKRAEYDRGLLVLRRRQRPPPFSSSSSSSPPFSGYSRRTWETDQCW